MKRRTIKIEIDTVKSNFYPKPLIATAYVVTDDGLRVDLDSDECAGDFAAWFDRHNNEIHQLLEWK